MMFFKTALGATMMRTMQAALLVLVLTGGGAGAAVYDGKVFDETRVVRSTRLVLNGVGKRVVVFFDAYYASLYLSRRCVTVDDVIATGGQRQLEVLLLRDVRLSMLESVFVDGLAKNVSGAELLALRPATDRLLEAMRRIKTFRKGDVLQLTFDGDATQVELNGTPVGAPIGDLAFNNALLSIWIGRAPIDAQLKERLLGARR